MLRVLSLTFGFLFLLKPVPGFGFEPQILHNPETASQFFKSNSSFTTHRLEDGSFLFFTENTTDDWKARTSVITYSKEGVALETKSFFGEYLISVFADSKRRTLLVTNKSIRRWSREGVQDIQFGQAGTIDTTSITSKITPEGFTSNLLHASVDDNESIIVYSERCQTRHRCWLGHTVLSKDGKIIFDDQGRNWVGLFNGIKTYDFEYNSYGEYSELEPLNNSFNYKVTQTWASGSSLYFSDGNNVCRHTKGDAVDFCWKEVNHGFAPLIDGRVIAAGARQLRRFNQNNEIDPSFGGELISSGNFNYYWFEWRVRPLNRSKLIIWNDKLVLTSMTSYLGLQTFDLVTGKKSNPDWSIILPDYAGPTNIKYEWTPHEVAEPYYNYYQYIEVGPPFDNNDTWQLVFRPSQHNYNHDRSEKIIFVNSYIRLPVR